VGTTYRVKSRNRGSVSALSAGAYTTTLYVIVDIIKRGGRALPKSPPSPGSANFSIMMECMPENGSCHSLCTLCVGMTAETVTVNTGFELSRRMCIVYRQSQDRSPIGQCCGAGGYKDTSSILADQ
jgi:hypothetical protein